MKSWLDGTNSEEELNICIFLKQLEKDTKSGEKFTLFVIHRDTKIVHAEAIDEYLLNKHRDNVDLKQEIEEILKKFTNDDDIESSIRRRAGHVINKNRHGKKLDKECRNSKTENYDKCKCIFRSGFQLVMWCGEKVFNAKGSSLDNRDCRANWINIWRGMFEMTLGERCPEELCKIEKPLPKKDTPLHPLPKKDKPLHPLPKKDKPLHPLPKKDKPLHPLPLPRFIRAILDKTKSKPKPVGGHVEKEVADGFWYILPICSYHNYKDRFDRGGQVMTTSPVAFAVRIAKMTDEEIERRRKEEKAKEEKKTQKAKEK